MSMYLRFVVAKSDGLINYFDKNFVAVVRSTLDCGSTPPSSFVSWRVGVDHVLSAAT